MSENNWVVQAYDCRQGEFFVIGPFASANDAFTWASNDAEEKATEWDMWSGIDAAPDETVTISDANEDAVYEWEVKQLISPK
jgi:hypothetical protein